MDVSKEQYWYFTFGCGQKHGGHYVKIYGTYASAMGEMFKRFGEEWCFQYSEEEWLEALNDPNRLYEMETELKLK